MRIFIAILLFIALGAISAQSNGYVKLSTSTINNSQLIQDLCQLGAEYTLEQGIFRSTKQPLYNGYWTIEKTESVYRKFSGGVTYYKYNVILECESVPTTIRSTYIVSFRASNGNTLVTSYSYKLISVNPEEETYDLPQFIDLQLLGNNAPLDENFNRGVDFTVADAIAQGKIQNAVHHVGRNFSIKDYGYSEPYVYEFLTTLVTKNGYTYRARITVPDLSEVPEEEQGNYPVTYVIYPNQ